MDLVGDVMKEYIKIVSSVVLSVGLLSMIVPKKRFGKYANMLTGITVVMVLLSPLLNISDSVDFDDNNFEKLEFSTNSYLMEELEKELAQKTQKELKSKTNIDFSVVVLTERENETITIKSVEISPYTMEYVKIVSDYLDIEEGKITQK